MAGHIYIYHYKHWLVDLTKIYLYKLQLQIYFDQKANLNIIITNVLKLM